MQRKKKNKMLKRRIVKITRKNGKVDYTIKKKVFPFVWITDSFDYWYGPGICEVMLRGMSYEAATDYIKKLEAEDLKKRGNKIIKKVIVE